MSEDLAGDTAAPVATAAGSSKQTKAAAPLSSSSADLAASRAGKPPARNKKDPRSQSPTVQLSRALSYLLRHGAEKEKLPIRADGFIPLEEVLKKSRCKSIDMAPDSGETTKDGKKKRREPKLEDVQRIIDEPGDKQRFELRREGDAETTAAAGGQGKGRSGTGAEGWFIRAIQGHTIESVVDLDHTPITLDNLAVLAFQQAEVTSSRGQQQASSQATAANSRDQNAALAPTLATMSIGDTATPSSSKSHALPEGVEILHGTTADAWEKIKESGGLSKMKRNHIHLARGRPGVQGVGSGMRASSPLLLHIDIVSALRDGVRFDLAANGAVLTAGVDSSGILPLKYISKVEQRASKGAKAEAGTVIWSRP